MRIGRVGVGPTVETGEITDATIVNADIAAAAAIASSKLDGSGCGVRMTAAQALTTGTNTAIAWDGTDDFDSDAYHDPASNNTRLTAPTTGLYLVYAKLAFAANGVGVREMSARVNGGATPEYAYVAENAPSATGTTYLLIAFAVRLTAADYVEIMALQTSGGNLNVGGSGVYQAHANMVRIGD